VSVALERVSVARLGASRWPSPLTFAQGGVGEHGWFVPEEAWLRHDIELGVGDAPVDPRLFERAGPRQSLFFEPRHVRAAIVTCGGLCPGLNSVVRSLFLELHFRYGVREVLGIRDGFLGLDPQRGRAPLPLTLDFVSTIHLEGGTALGTSRGPHAISTMADTLAALGIDMLFCVGGDGTHRAAHALAQEVAARRLAIAVVGLPKTIDCDLGYCDRTFGFLTAVEKARDVIHLAHTEACSTPRGIGLVKLMGRHAGFVACLATRVSQEVNFTLIPEVAFALGGDRGFLAALTARMAERGHAVIVVAEGAGQDLFTEPPPGRDASGNARLHDVGALLKREIGGHFAGLGQPVEVKYFDPSYILRSAPANTADAILCDSLARHAAHAAMAGRTDVMIGLRHDHFVHVPIALAVAAERRVDPASDLWSEVVAATGQPVRFG
jgi:6-phosphofructokinase 1